MRGRDRNSSSDRTSCHHRSTAGTLVKNRCPPMSNRQPSRSTVRLIPPTTVSASNTVAGTPRRVSSWAAVRPAGAGAREAAFRGGFGGGGAGAPPARPPGPRPTPPAGGERGGGGQGPSKDVSAGRASSATGGRYVWRRGSGGAPSFFRSSGLGAARAQPDGCFPYFHRFTTPVGEEVATCR